MRWNHKTTRIGLLILALVCVGVLMRPIGKRLFFAILRRTRRSYTVADRLAQYGAAARGRLEPGFHEAGVAYPPDGITLIGIKDIRVLELWAEDAAGAQAFIKAYPILGASGVSGPKLREGDGQVPEGFYRVESLNPNSLYHLALRLDYPNDFDVMRAAEDGRADPGSDIMIHGKTCSIGCLAMGDPAIEEIFVLAADVGATNIAVILTPTDMRTTGAPEPPPDAPPWTAQLYDDIAGGLSPFRRAERGSAPPLTETRNSP